MESFASSGDNSLTSDITTCLQKLASMNRNHEVQENNKTDEVNDLNNANKDEVCNGDSSPQDLIEIKKYIDSKFSNLEKKLVDRIELLDKKVNEKLDSILKKLQLSVIISNTDS